MKHFIPGKLVACDTETTGLWSWHGHRPFAFSFCNDDGVTAYREFPVDPVTRKPQASRRVLRELRRFYMDPDVVKVWHNAKFDVEMIRGAGICNMVNMETKRWLVPTHDTLVMARTCKSDEPSLSLKKLSEQYAGVPTDDLDELLAAVKALRTIAKNCGFAEIGYETKMAADGSINKKQLPFVDYWLPRAFHLHHPEMIPDKYRGCETWCERYAVIDAERTMLLYHMYNDVMDETPQLRKTYKEEMELLPIVYCMERRGVHISFDRVDVLNREAMRVRDNAKKELLKYAWPDFNPHSNIDCEKLFFDVLKLKPLKQTPGGRRSVDLFTMEKYIEKHNAVRMWARYKAAIKVMSSVYYKYKTLSGHDPLTNGRCIHPSFNTVGTRTGRFSCSNPNIQNLATRNNTVNVASMEARKPLGPRNGFVWFEFDYSGQEVRIIAVGADDKKLIHGILNESDIFAYITRNITRGANNNFSIHHTIRNLGLKSEVMPEFKLIKKAWKVLGLKRAPKNHDGCVAAASEWLERHDWDIINAEKSIGMKPTRQRIKKMVYAKFYGMGIVALADFMQMTPDETAEMVHMFATEFSSVEAFTVELVQRARRDGFVCDLYGNILVVGGNDSYKGVNYFVQGTAARMMKSAIRRSIEMLVEKYPDRDVHAIITVHDDLIFEIRNEHVTRELLRDIRDVMADNVAIMGEIPTPVGVEMVRDFWGSETEFDI